MLNPQEAARQLTLRHLLSHTGGFPRGATNKNVRDELALERVLMEELSNLEMRSLPEEGKYQYSNLGINIAGLIVQTVTGKRYSQLARELVLDPLGIQYICEQAKNSIAFLNLEGYSAGFTTLKRKGIASFRFDVTGKETHSSRCTTEGANAIAEAAHKILTLEKLKDNDGITCNCAVISGGTVVNTVPGKCSFSTNFRFATQEQLDWIKQYVKEVAETVHVPGCTCTVEQISIRVALELTERNQELLKKANRIFAENGLPCLEGRMVRGGADGADVTAYGIPCLDSLGVVGSGTHSIGEYAELDSLADCAKRIGAVAYCI